MCRLDKVHMFVPAADRGFALATMFSERASGEP